MLSGTAFGAGTATIPLPIPAGIRGVAYRQWAELQRRPTNLVRDVLSNGRRMIVQ